MKHSTLFVWVFIGVAVVIVILIAYPYVDRKMDERVWQQAAEDAQEFKASLVAEERKMASNMVKMIREMESRGIDKANPNQYEIMKSYRKDANYPGVLDDRGRFLYHVEVVEGTSQSELENLLQDIDTDIIFKNKTNNSISEQPLYYAILAVPFYDLRAVASLSEVKTIRPYINPQTD